ncbi:MAG: fumarate hydratase [Spirochaetaceae bacterium]|jgi:fumarate hydratase subunit alpha|nr:fumarate hydratase [Spirochaetaceae bacterium]
MKIVEAARITEVVKGLCIRANRDLPEDVQACLRSGRDAEPWPLAQDTLDKIIANFELAASRRLPICQDTGLACVFLEIGAEVHIEGDLYGAINEGVRQGYQEGYLRKSVVADPLNRVNTGDNTPAMVYLEVAPGDRLGITVAPKGFGSENMSQIKMLKPSDGEAGVMDFVVSVVKVAGSNPCPPLVVGVGLGGTFDKAALLAKKALLRPLGQRNPVAYYRDLEYVLLERINALGIGPQGFGGATTALSVAIETMPTHIAGLPCAVNINCHVARHAQEDL